MTRLFMMCVCVLMLSLAEHAQATTVIRRSKKKSKSGSLKIDSDGSIDIKRAASAQQSIEGVGEADSLFDTDTSRSGRRSYCGVAPGQGHVCARDHRAHGWCSQSASNCRRCNGRWCSPPTTTTTTTTNFDTSTVICPFLATLLNEGALDKKNVHTAQELADVSIAAGLPNSTVQGHTFEGNFRDIPSMRINVFDMEGNVNEHLTSTGITDCPSSYPISSSTNCPLDSVTQAPKCPTPDTGCRRNATFVQEKFDTFFRIADTNSDGFLDVDELEPAEEQYNSVLGNLLTPDVNFGLHVQPPHPVEGRIHGAFTMFTEVFGEECRRISRATLQRTVVENRYPSHFTFPNQRNCP